jgi:hypothetical protein
LRRKHEVWKHRSAVSPLRAAADNFPQTQETKPSHSIGDPTTLAIRVKSLGRRPRCLEPFVKCSTCLPHKKSGARGHLRA